MNPPAIEIRGLTKQFSRFALGPLDLTVPAGAIYGLIGPNGSGKSTTMDLLFGMGRKDGGSMRAAGFDHVREEMAMKRVVTYSSPDTSFAVWGKVGSVIRFVKDFYPAWDQELCLRLLDVFRLRPGDKISQLSFGARTKLSLLLALCPRPRVLVLDEPTTGLDPEARQILMRELLRLVEDETRTVLISSHQLSDVERFADHVGILSKGRLICEGPTADLVARHRMVEYSLAEGGAFPPMAGDLAGFHPRRREGDRCLAVVDLEANPVETLEARGLRIHSKTELSLEEIFLALTSGSAAASGSVTAPGKEAA
ncbi:MAG: ABC transporter ATP-binding protein [Verrucomicrobiota bacterium]